MSVLAPHVQTEDHVALLLCGQREQEYDLIGQLVRAQQGLGRLAQLSGSQLDRQLGYTACVPNF